MKNEMILSIGLAILLGASAPLRAAETPAVELELEAGAVWQSYNDVQIPNTSAGTRFSLSDVVGNGPWTAGRAYLTWNINERHGLRALYAPLSIKEPGVFAEPLSFAGEDFVAGSGEAVYTFNSYRLSYRYRFRESPTTTWWLGFTAKIRDAQIAVIQGSQRAVKDDLGFVPLLHIAGERRLGDGWHLNFDADALAGGPGRAEDVSLKVAKDLSRRVRLSAGYRLVEGGADVEEVYTFAWLHFAVAGIRIAF